MDVTLAEVVDASRAVAATRSRTAKTQALADLFARCDPAEVGLVVSHNVVNQAGQLKAEGIMANNLDARSFITMTYSIVDLRERTMTYARAGHTPLMYLPGNGAPPGPDGRRMRILVPDGLVLGLQMHDAGMFERLLEEQTIPLRDGDLYTLYTDGISEAMNEADDCFGDDRLGRLLEEHAHLPSEELRERVLREIAAFVGTAPQHDDMTMILLRIDRRA